MSDIDVTIFDKPSGNSRGVAVAFFGEGKKRKRVAHAHFLVDAAPEITLWSPGKLSLADVAAYADTLKAFHEAVERESMK